MPSSKFIWEMPNFNSPSEIAFNRSDSFTLSSAASLIIVSPSANAAAIDKIGISSIILGIIDPSRITPDSVDGRTIKSAIGSPDYSLAFLTSILAPISRNTFNTPIRLGFIPTPQISNFFD